MSTTPKKEPRDRQLNLSLTEAEYKSICARAKEFGVRVAHYARLRVLAEHDNAFPVSHETPSVLERLLYNQLSRIGNNLNQAMRHCHQTGAPLPPDLEPLLADIRQMIARLRP